MALTILAILAFLVVALAMNKAKKEHNNHKVDHHIKNPPKPIRPLLAEKQHVKVNDKKIQNPAAVTTVDADTSHNDSGPSVIGKSYRINYRDSSGNDTERVITIQKLKRSYGSTYIEAFCHLRNEVRTFALDSVKTYIVDTDTGELVDPEILSWNHVKRIIPAEKAKQALFLEISEKVEGWVVHDPYDDISTKQKRKELGLVAYNMHRDAYCAAIDRTVEKGYGVLCIFLGGKYQVPKGSKNKDLIDIYAVDLSTDIGVSKANWLYNLCNS